MILATTLSLYAGGPGSGCNPSAGKCGRPKRAADDTEQVRYNSSVALSNYGQLGSDQVNGWLRRGKPKPTTIAEQDAAPIVEDMDKAFSTSGAHKTFDKAQTVYRGIENYGMFKKLTRGGAARWKGTVLEDKGFVSTSESQEIAQYAAGGYVSDNSIMLEIAVPKGTAYLQPTGHPQEKERILKRGARFRITKYDYYPKERSQPASLRLKVKLVK